MITLTKEQSEKLQQLIKVYTDNPIDDPEDYISSCIDCDASNLDPDAPITYKVYFHLSEIDYHLKELIKLGEI